MGERPRIRLRRRRAPNEAPGDIAGVKVIWSMAMVGRHLFALRPASEKSFPPRETQFLFVRPRVSRKIIDSQIVPLARNTLKQSDQRFDYGVVSLYLAVNFHGHFFAVHMRCHVPCLQQ